MYFIRQNPLRLKTNFTRIFNPITPVQPLSKNIPLASSGKSPRSFRASRLV
jgi:hypothetical protein